MINKLGLNGLSKLNSPKTQTMGNGGGNSFIIGRVLDIILNEEHPLFNEYGQYNSIGIIEIELIVGGNNGTKRIVKPLFPNIKSYPLVNELVTCFPLPIPTLDSSRLDTQYYYLNSINTWNHPHHNALPTPTPNNIIFTYRRGSGKLPDAYKFTAQNPSSAVSYNVKVLTNNDLFAVQPSEFQLSPRQNQDFTISVKDGAIETFGDGTTLFDLQLEILEIQ
jgi:hypothetical protein